MNLSVIKNHFKKIIVIATLGIFLAAGIIFNQKVYLGGPIPDQLSIDGQTLSVAYTDDNSGEDLIIKSDKQIYTGWNSTITFSITNTSNKDQNVAVVFSTPNNKWSLNNIKRFIRNDTIIVPGYTIPATATSSEIIVPDSSKQVSVWEDLVTNSGMVSTQITRKNVSGTAIKNFSTFIKSGETVFLEAELALPSDILESMPMQKRLYSTQIDTGEFFIEAFGSKSYGHLDPSTLLNNIVAYWKMDESSDGSAQVDRADEVATASNMTDVSPYAASMAGIITNAVNFELSASEHFLTADAAKLDITGDISISVWVNFEQKPSTAGDYFWILSKYDASSGTNEMSYYLMAGPTDTFKTSYCSVTNCAQNTTFNTNANVIQDSWVGTWHHIVVTADVSATDWNCWVDGTSITFTSEQNDATSIVNSAAALYIGAENRLDSIQRFFDGGIDEVGIWSRILTNDEIAELYNTGTGCQYDFSNCAAAPSGWEDYDEFTEI